MFGQMIRHLLLMSFYIHNSLAFVTTREEPTSCLDPSNYLDVITDVTRAFYKDHEDFSTAMSALMLHQSHSTLADSRESLNFDSSVSANETRCPWRWKLNVDPNRIPSDIAEAICDCEHCQTENSDSGGTSGRCRPVHGPVLVVRRICDSDSGDNTYRYQPELHNVAVGCTCVSRTLS